MENQHNASEINKKSRKLKTIRQKQKLCWKSWEQINKKYKNNQNNTKYIENQDNASYIYLQKIDEHS